MTDAAAAPLLFPLALLIDCLFSEPPARCHPVVFMGLAADRLEAFFRKKAPSLSQNEERGLFLAGSLAALSHILLFALPVFLVCLLFSSLHAIAGFLFASACLWLCLAPKSLARHAEDVFQALEQDDIQKSRTLLARIVGRRTDALDRHAVARACIESVAENCTDSTLTTLFWGCAGFLLAGFPGACALAFAQRAANTLDAMWGHKSAPYLFFGRTAARLDDAFNYLPARLSLACISLAAFFVRGASARDAWQTGLRYHSAHESPNSAWSEAAFAGALHLRLGGPASYPGLEVNHPLIGDGTPDAEPEHIRQACALMWASVWICAGFFSLCLVLLHAAHVI